MITLFRWILMKQKEIKLKLTFYRFLEEGIKALSDSSEERSSENGTKQ